MTKPSYDTDHHWQNAGRNLQAIVARYYEPTTTEEVQEIVRMARRDGRRVRVVGDSHSWSPLSVTEDYLICTKRLNRILEVSTDPPRITVQPGVRIAETLQAFRENGVCMPMNVDIPTLTVGGVVSVGANGFSQRWGPYSDFIREVELVDGTGALRVIHRERDPELWRAVSLSLGLCGIFTRITLDLQPSFHVHVVNRVLDMQTALDGMMEAYARHDYVQYFWFPFNRTVTLQVGDVTTAPPTWTRLKSFLNDVKGWLETAATHLVHPVLLGLPSITPWFTWVAGRSMGASEEVMEQNDNMLLGEWINFMVPSLNASVSFPPGPDDRHMREAWTTAVDLIDDYARRGLYPANLAMNMRLFGPSEALLHTVPGADGPIFNIQLTSFPNPHWEGFKDELMQRWLTIPGARPHWAKQYQGLPGIAQTLREVYGESLVTFLRIREEAGLDPDDVFVNPFLRDLLMPSRATEVRPASEVA